MSSSSGMWAGISMAVVGNTAINFGTNLIKYSHQKAALEDKEMIPTTKAAQQGDEDRPSSSESPERSDSSDLLPSSSSVCVGTRVSKQSFNLKLLLHTATPKTIWTVGFTLFALGSILNFVAFGFAAQSLLASLGSIQFITNVIFSVYVLESQISKRTIVATVFIVIGNLLIVVFAQQGVTRQSGDDLMHLYTKPAYLWYLLSVVIISAFMQCLFVYIQSKHEGVRIRNRFPFSLLNLLPALRCVTRVEFPVEVEKKMSGLAFAISSAMIGTQSVVLAKSCSELLRTTLGGSNQFTHPFTYVVLTAWILSITFWLKRLNRALVLFDGVFIIPVCQVVWILFSVTAGGIYFQEFAAFSSLDAKMFVMGILVINMGVYFLASDPVSSKKPSRATTNAPADWADVLMNVGFDVTETGSPIGARSLSEADMTTPFSNHDSPFHSEFSRSAPDLFNISSEFADGQDEENPLRS